MVTLASTPADPVDVLVLAPHPDDEVIRCGGVIQQAIAAGKRVRVAFTTSGDGYSRAASVLFGKPETLLTAHDLAVLGQTRELEAVAAARELGLSGANLTFLRYPDAGMARLAPPERAKAAGDFLTVLQGAAPSAVYVTDAADEHHDHRATNELVLGAVTSTRYRGELFTFMVHSGGDLLWPEPGVTYQARKSAGVAYPAGVTWPPPVRIPLSGSESAVKLRALRAHASQWAVDREYLGRFVKSEEIFWLRAVAT